MALNLNQFVTDTGREGSRWPEREYYYCPPYSFIYT